MPITATFLAGVLWKRATGRAAFATLVTGGLRRVDSGALNALVRFRFLKYSVIVFLFCMLLMFVITVTEPRRGPAAEDRLTIEWGVGCFTPGPWIHFR